MSRVIDYGPTHNITLANLRLKVRYKGYMDAEWYEARKNRDVLKTAAFEEYAETHGELAGFLVR